MTEFESRERISEDVRLEEGRIVPRMNPKEIDLSGVLKKFGLVPQGEVSSYGEGRIANNWALTCDDGVEYVVRAYPVEYGQSKVKFEASVLGHLSDQGEPVPAPLSIQESGELVELGARANIIVYPALQGDGVSQEDLNAELVTEAGERLVSLLRSGRDFDPGQTPTGDVEFIYGLLRALRENNADFASLSVLPAMEEVLTNSFLLKRLASSPQGIVHADYYFENILVKDGHINGILDFGDAYIGAQVNDIAISAMEFSVLSDNSWNIDFLGRFAQSVAPWLKENEISAEIILETMRANCVRFAVYTVPLFAQEAIAAAENPYVKRFSELSAELGDEVRSQFSKVL